LEDRRSGERVATEGRTKPEARQLALQAWEAKLRPAGQAPTGARERKAAPGAPGVQAARGQAALAVLAVAPGSQSAT
jgi:hypothetical protein